MINKQLWMRPGARVLANGHPAEIVAISYLTKEGAETVNFIHVCRDGNDEVECYRPHQVQRDRIRREVCNA